MSGRADRVSRDKDVAVRFDVLVRVVVRSVDRAASDEHQVRAADRQRVIAERHVARDADGNRAGPEIRNRLRAFRSVTGEQTARVDRQRGSCSTGNQSHSGRDVDKPCRVDVDVVSGNVAVDVEAGCVEGNVTGVGDDPARGNDHLICFGQEDPARSGIGRSRHRSAECELKRVGTVADRLIRSIRGERQIRGRNVGRGPRIAVSNRPGPSRQSDIAGVIVEFRNRDSRSENGQIIVETRRVDIDIAGAVCRAANRDLSKPIGQCVDIGRAQVERSRSATNADRGTRRERLEQQRSAAADRVGPAAKVNLVRRDADVRSGCDRVSRSVAEDCFVRRRHGECRRGGNRVRCLKLIDVSDRNSRRVARQRAVNCDVVIAVSPVDADCASG